MDYIKDETANENIPVNQKPTVYNVDPTRHVHKSKPSLKSFDPSPSQVSSLK